MTLERAKLLGFVLGMVGLVAGGLALGNSTGSPPAAAATITLPGRTVVVHHTRVLKKVVRGRVIKLKGGQRVVYVPLVVIHDVRCHPTRHNHCVRRVVVPAHTIPLRAATIHQTVAVAAVSVPVTVVVTDFQTVTLPAQTQTQTETTTQTETDLVTVTVTVPPVS